MNVVLLHAGIADSRMWAPQLESFGREHRIIAPDLPGFGTSPFTSSVVDYRAAVRRALDGAGMDQAVLVGVSMGGTTALEVAVESPERVSALVLVGPGLPDHQWSETITSFAAAEEEALASGDLEAAIDTNLRTWLAGPNRSLDAIDPELRERVAEMQRDAFRLQKGHDDARADHLEPPVSERLGDVRMPTLIITGDEDVEDIEQIADRLAAGIPGATRARIAGAAHLPNLERPDEFDRIVLEFLRRNGR